MGNRRGWYIVRNADPLQQYTPYRNCLVEGMMFKISRVYSSYDFGVLLHAGGFFARAAEENSVLITQQKFAMS